MRLVLIAFSLSIGTYAVSKTVELVNAASQVMHQATDPRTH